MSLRKVYVPPLQGLCTVLNVGTKSIYAGSTFLSSNIILKKNIITQYEYTPGSAPG